MTLNDVTAVILRYFTERVRCRRKTIISVWKSTFNSLWPY